MLVFDGVIFYLTVHKAFELNKQRGVSLLRILLRDGALNLLTSIGRPSQLFLPHFAGAVYFAVMIIANVANIITFFVRSHYIFALDGSRLIVLLGWPRTLSVILQKYFR